ncbi:hypothetical protein L210DRAFT_854280 [Boletus edulis BED1]|uniref:Uncharacterized protein n=1 Tax=Boletus edulis BED1 TaxID=1328754 RepID=A0AAD4GFW1_BOLED|nr:hypothetical protein L210DRAFT_854280 [Boletus edulis BED1]
MQPVATKLDLPSTHDVCTFIHNSFINFLKELKSEIQARYCFILSSHFLYLKLH